MYQYHKAVFIQNSTRTYWRLICLICLIQKSPWFRRQTVPRVNNSNAEKVASIKSEVSLFV